jgi:hypothetical protein
MEAIWDIHTIFRKIHFQGMAGLGRGRFCQSFLNISDAALTKPAPTDASVESIVWLSKPVPAGASTYPSMHYPIHPITNDNIVILEQFRYEQSHYLIMLGRQCLQETIALLRFAKVCDRLPRNLCNPLAQLFQNL